MILYFFRALNIIEISFTHCNSSTPIRIHEIATIVLKTTTIATSKIQVLELH